MLLRIEKDRLELLYNSQKKLPGGWQKLEECVNSIRMSILTSKSWHPKCNSRRVSGGYYLEILQLVKWSEGHADVSVKECIAKYKLPCTGNSKHNCLPIVTTHVMNTYMEWLTSTNSGKREKAGINKCQKVTKAVRSILCEAERLCLHFVGNQVNCTLSKPSFQSNYLTVSALNNTRKKKSIQQGGISVSGKKIKQSDFLRGQVHAALTDKQLESFTPWFLLRKPVEGVKKRPGGNKYKIWPPTDDRDYFEAVRDNYITKCMHQALLRGDDIRSKQVTWAHNGILRVVIDGTVHYLFFILKDTGKSENKKKKIRSYLTGFLRHVNPMLCPVCAQGIYFIMAFGKGGMRTFPDVFNPDDNWPESCYLVTNKAGNRPMYYKRNTFNDTDKDKEHNSPDDGMHEIFHMLKKAAGLDHLQLVTHFRKLGALYGECTFGF